MKSLALLALLAGACTTGEPTAAVSRLDVDVYVRDVYPYMAARCGTLDCHGMAGRPLRIYSELSLRASADLRGKPITMAEQVANVHSVEGVDPGAAPDDSMVLRKPLAKALGGIDHKGLELWPDCTAPGYLCLRGWLAGQPDSAACAAAYDPVKIPDPPDAGP